MNTAGVDNCFFLFIFKFLKITYVSFSSVFKFRPEYLTGNWIFPVSKNFTALKKETAAE